MLLSGQFEVVAAAVILQLPTVKQIIEVVLLANIWHEIWLTGQHTVFEV